MPSILTLEIVASNGPRKWEPREFRYVSEWASLNYPGADVRTRVRVGAPPEELTRALGADKAAATFKSWMKWVDAAVFRPEEVVLIEAKLRATTSAVGQLLYYRDLFGKTREFREHWTKPRTLIVLTPWADPDLDAFAGAQGVEIVRWQPSWLDEYVQHIQHYNSKEYQDRKRAREIAELD